MNLIDKARESLAGNWHQGSYDGPNGTGCVLNHFDRATGGRTIKSPHFETWLFVDSFARTEAGTNIYAFNDDPSTTEEDMLLFLKKASVAYDEQQGAAS